MTTEQNLENLRHSCAHLLAAAVMELWPHTHRTIGPSIENGFYFDFDFGDTKISEEDLPRIEAKMLEILPSWKGFERFELDPKAAKKEYPGNTYKHELIDEFTKEGQKLTFYKSGNYWDLCRGGHIDLITQSLNHFKLLSIAGAYWRGSEKNKMLTRIYGTCWPTQNELDDYLTKIEEAKKRDHRKLGRELDLFHIDEKVGLGLPLWHPKGAILWRVIEDFWYKEHLKNGYELVRTPHIGNSNLWKTSGHLNFYNSSMYPPLEAGQALEEKQQGKSVVASEEYYLKPMNCPFHVQIYNDRPKSYRDLPLRWAECGTVYRYEKKGELSGLIRVRGFTQDDAHIICRKEQVEDELIKVINFIKYIYESFGFSTDTIHVFLSLRDPENKQKYAGEDSGWNFTEDILRKVAVQTKLNFKEEIGEAAFYGPKLDFKIKDSLGRLWQCSTLQFDFNLPERFGLTFTNERGEKETPYMLHRALFGSYERFIGLLIEHYGGNLPVWLAPVQAVVLPITDKHLEYARRVHDQLSSMDIRSNLDSRNEPLSGRIRDAEMQKIPYILAVGDREAAAESVSVRKRGEKGLNPLSLSQITDQISNEIKNKSLL